MTETDPGVALALAVEDIKHVYPAITNYCTNQQILDNITSALTVVQIAFEAKGFVWATISNLDKAKLPIAYKVVELASLGQFVSPDDKFIKRAEIYAGMYNELMGQIEFTADTAAGDTAKDASINNSYSVITR